MDDDFVAADARNLPKIDLTTITEFFKNNTDFLSAEQSGVKAVSSSEKVVKELGSLFYDDPGMQRLRRTVIPLSEIMAFIERYDDAFVKFYVILAAKIRLRIKARHCAAYHVTDIEGLRDYLLQGSTREAYGDDAIGYVCVRREWPVCTAKCRITPEHRVRIKGYEVEILVNEEESEVVSVKCRDCPASEGGCKHALAFLFWLHRRSEDRSVTETTCYWKKARLAKVGTGIKFIRAEELRRRKKATPAPTVAVDISEDFHNEACKMLKEKKIENQFTVNVLENSTHPLSIHSLLLDFSELSNNGNANDFLLYTSKRITARACSQISQQTKKQAEEDLWFELRYARVTGSIIHEAAHCSTEDGSLMEKILGAKTEMTKFMKRGKLLEPQVLKVVSKHLNVKLLKSGLLLNSEWPVLGGSPDAVGSDGYVYEVKCPASAKTFKSYVNQGKMSKKCKAQLMTQMFLANAKKGCLCVAYPDFEESQKVMIILADYDEHYCKDLFERATKYWTQYVFPKLMKDK